MNELALFNDLFDGFEDDGYLMPSFNWNRIPPVISWQIPLIHSIIKHPIGDVYKAKIKNVLMGLGFSEDDFSLPIEKLSGGQKTRVALCKILLTDTNLLLLDEPTNHLDIASREALENALEDYDGTMLMVSHDRYFINKLADRILYLTPNGVIGYDGNYDDYLEGRRNVAEENSQTEEIKDKAADYKELKRQESEKRKIQNRHKKVEELIEETEQKITNLELEFNKPEINMDYKKSAEITEQINNLRKEIDGYMEEWESLQQMNDEISDSK